MERRTGKNPPEALAEAIERVRPQVEVKSRRVGGANYQVPVEVRSERGVALAMRWLRDAMRKGSEKSTARRLARELAEAAEGRGIAVKKREDVHRMAAANKGLFPLPILNCDVPPSPHFALPQHRHHRPH